ncbi:MAG: hypothetical protein JWO76_1673 [Nocardioides sp.]|nr:hypothetical protein [Nocardioides sp.]
MDPASTPDRLSRNAGKRAWLVVIWVLVSVLLAVIALQFEGDGPAARAGGTVGVLQLLELVPMFLLVALNFSLRRDPTQARAAGPAGLSMVLTLVLVVAGIVLVFAADDPYDVSQLPFVLIFAGVGVVPFMLGMGRRLDALRGGQPTGVARPQL